MSIQMQIHIESSDYVECCCFIAELEPIRDKKFMSGLNEDELAFVRYIQAHNAHGMIEYFVNAEDKSFKGIVDFIQRMDSDSFYYYLNCESIPMGEVGTLDPVFKAHLKSSFLSLLDQCRPHVTQVIQNEDPSELYRIVFEKLKKSSPLELAQEYMGKRFFRVSDYLNYHFIPAYFFNSSPVRIFSDSTLVLLIPLHEQQKVLTTVELSEALRVIADPTRLQIMELLKSKAMYGKEIAEELDMKAATITHHVEQLNKIGLLHTERSGQIKYFSLNRIRYAELLKQLSGFMS